MPFLSSHPARATIKGPFPPHATAETIPYLITHHTKKVVHVSLHHPPAALLTPPSYHKHVGYVEFESFEVRNAVIKASKFVLLEAPRAHFHLCCNDSVDAPTVEEVEAMMPHNGSAVVNVEIVFYFEAVEAVVEFESFEALEEAMTIENYYYFRGQRMTLIL